MQIDFHYYATYCAACFAGYDPSESLDIAYSAQLVDISTRTFLSKINAPLDAATTQSQLELADARADAIGRRDITAIWASFHFLPGDLYADVPKSFKMYRNKFRLICNTNSDLLIDTANLLLYFIALHGISGGVQLLRALEQRKQGAPGWRLKMLLSIGNLFIAIACIIFIRSEDIVVIIYAIGLFYSGAIRILNAVKKSDIIYIQ